MTFVSSPRILSFRQRLVNFISSQPELASLPGEVQLRILMKAIPECDFLTMVWSYVSTTEDQIDLLFANTDVNQIRVRIRNIV